MKILFDQGTPSPLRRHLSEHTVKTVHEENRSTLSNGELLNAAEKAGYYLFVLKPVEFIALLLASGLDQQVQDQSSIE